MKKHLIIICLVFAAIMPSHAYTLRNLLQNSASENEVRAALVMDQKWVPYPSYDDRAGWEHFFGNFRDTLIKAGEKYLDYHWRVIRATDYLEFEKSGSRNIMQVPNNKNAQAFSAMLVAELAEGKGRFVNDLMNGIFFFCEMSSWAESAHLMAYQKTKRAIPDYREQILELHQGGMAQMLSWTYYFLKDRLDAIDPIIAMRLRHELQVRELDPYLLRDDFWWMATHHRPGLIINNWNPWCNANALFCFMLLENNRDTLARAVWKSMQSVDRFLNFVKSDGACEEGPSYWGHAAGKLYDYLSALSMITGGRVSLFDHPQVRAMGEYIAYSYIGNEWVANFADASARASEINTSLIYRYGVAVKSSVMKSMAAMREKNHPSRIPTNWMDLYLRLEDLRSLPKLRNDSSTFSPPAYVWYPETEFCYMRREGTFLAAKGGFNNESHNHNDVGTFILAFNNVPVMIDAGVGTYTRKTFSSERYTIPTMQSNYHNLPMINGMPQRFGSVYKAIDTKADSSRQTFSANIATAYPPEAKVAKWVRGYRLGKSNLTVTDDFVLKEAKAPNMINFMTRGHVDISTKGMVNIDIKKTRAQLIYDANLFEPSVEEIELSDVRLSNVWGKKIYRITLTSKKRIKSGHYQYEIKEVR